MANAVTVKFDAREFNATLRKYSALSKRTPAEIVNRKAYMITRRAIWHTRRANAAAIQHELGGHEAFVLHVNKSGKNKGKFSQAKKHATVAFDLTGRFARIIIAQFRKAGKEIPAAAELSRYIQKAFKARLRSIGFIASGFVEPRDKFKAWCQSHGVSIGKAGIPNEGKSGPKQLGPSKKGGATPANFNWFTRATFFNSANSKHGTKKGALLTYGEPGLAKAFQDETVDTIAEIEKRLKEHATACGIKHH